MLDTLGFKTRGLAARVMWDVPEGAVLPRTHMLLAIEAGARTFIADVGFGGMTLTAPLLFELGFDQPTAHETYRIDTLAAPDEYVLQARLGGGLRSLYRFTLEAQHDADYEMANHFVSTYPQSVFRHTLRVARATSDSRYALLNRRLSVYGPHAEQRTLASPHELRDVLQNVFGIRLPWATGRESDDAIETLFARLDA